MEHDIVKIISGRVYNTCGVFVVNNETDEKVIK